MNWRVFCTWYPAVVWDLLLLISLVDELWHLLSSLLPNSLLMPCSLVPWCLILHLNAEPNSNWLYNLAGIVSFNKCPHKRCQDETRTSLFDDCIEQSMGIRNRLKKGPKRSNLDNKVVFERQRMIQKTRWALSVRSFSRRLRFQNYLDIPQCHHV